MNHTATVSDTTNSTNVLTYNTRFGDVTLREDRLVGFDQGVLGFPHCKVFGLSRMPGGDESPILLMHCISDPSVTFMVADPAVLGLEIKEKDQKEAIAARKMDETETQILVILTLYEQGDSFFLTANLRAPLLIDSKQREGFQHILTSNDYTTQHKI